MPHVAYVPRVPHLPHVPHVHNVAHVPHVLHVAHAPHVHHAVSPTIGVRRRMAREPKAKVQTRTHQAEGGTFPTIPDLYAEEQSWVGTRVKLNEEYMPIVTEVR